MTIFFINTNLLIYRVDDIEDDSTLRRGAPVAHHIYGMAQTINCANYAYFLALQELQKLSNGQMMTIFSEEILNLHRGQGIELFWRDSITCPTEEEFIDMINNSKFRFIKKKSSISTFDVFRQKF